MCIRDSRDTQALGAAVEAAQIVHRAEQLDISLRIAVSLHSLENGLAIMQHHGSGIQRKIAVGNNAGVMPALALRIVHDEHMVGKDLAKTELGFIL